MFEADGEPEVRRDRILVLMQSANNVALLGTALGSNYSVVSDLHDVGAGDEIDMIVVDGYSLYRFDERIKRMRSAQEPLHLPVLLLSDREANEIRSPRLAGIVDDIVKRPLSRSELVLRIASMMRARALSRQMADLEKHHANERRVAERFQDAALPRDLPVYEHLSFSAFYNAGQSVATIGGDWYDALVLDDGRVVVTIGDVLGSGLEAAVAMAHIRQVARGVAHIHPDPRMMLDAANRNLHAEGKGRIVTAFVGVIDMVSSELTFANAGHPAPIVRYADGSIVELPLADLPLGVSDATAEVRTVSFPAEASLVLYTDGLVEGNRELLRDRASLMNVIRNGRFLNAPEPAGALYDEVVQTVGPDDVAIMIVRRGKHEPVTLRLTFDSTDEASFRNVKLALCERLSAIGYEEADCFIAEMILTELIGNVVRYAPGNVEVALQENGRNPVLHVMDRGPSFTYAPRLPSSVYSESGRGLYMVRELSREFNVTQRVDGGSHARAVFART